VQVALTAATDTSELLGSFEQADRAQALAVAERRLASASLAAAAAAATAGCFDLAAAATDTWQAYTAARLSCCDAETTEAAYEAACLAAAAAAASAGDAASSSWSVSVAAYASVAATQTAAASGGFEWVDGVLLEAMDVGDWVLLDNANLCSPTVLDRLNPLLEPGGELLIPEAGLVGGAPRRSYPAPGFRLLLALDPRHGEVSRAMRNRGIEVFILPTHASADEVRELGAAPNTRPCAPPAKFSIRAACCSWPTGQLWHLGPRPDFAHSNLGRAGAAACVRPRQPCTGAPRICALAAFGAR
jgi:midasin